ncbi:oligosaccharide flippase family protein [Vibrio chagasii]|nr:oligosaccharide flippase family protein [Vibrio chagasii]
MKSIFSFINLVLIAQYYSVDVVGDYSLFISYFSLCIPLVVFGFEHLLIKCRIDNDYKTVSIIYNTQIIVSIVLMVIIFCMYLLDMIGMVNFYFFIIGVAFLPLNFFRFINFADLKFKQNCIITLCSVFFLMILRILALENNYSILAIKILFLADLFLPLIIITIINFNNRMKFELLIFLRVKEYKPIVIIGFNMMVSSLVILVFMRMDQFMLAKISNSHELGLYSVASRINDGFLMLSSLLISTSFPYLVRMHSDSLDSFVNEASKVIKKVYKLIFPIILLCLLLSSEFISVLFGEEYYNSGKVLSVLIFMQLLSPLGLMISRISVLEKKTSLLMKVNILGLISNMVLNFFLIPEFGSLGAAIATILTQLITCFLIWLVLDFKVIKLLFFRMAMLR